MSIAQSQPAPLPSNLITGMAILPVDYASQWHLSRERVDGLCQLMCADALSYQGYTAVVRGTIVLVIGALVAPADDEFGSPRRPVLLFPDGRMATFMMRRFSLKGWASWRTL